MSEDILSPRKRLLFCITSIFLTLTIILLACEGLATLFYERKSSREINPQDLYVHDPVIGWDNASNKKLRAKKIDYDIQITTLQNGIRLTHSIEKDGKKVGVFGDSFVFGWGVNDHETFSSRLSKLLPNANVVNGGVNGYSPDQYLLKYQESVNKRGFSFDYLIFAIFPPNDLTVLNSNYFNLGTRFYEKNDKPLKTKPKLVRKGNGFEFEYPKEAFLPLMKPAPSFKGNLYRSLRNSKLFKFLYERRHLFPPVFWISKKMRKYFKNDKDTLLQTSKPRLKWIFDKIKESNIPVLYLLIPSRNMVEGQTVGAPEDYNYKAIKNFMKKEVGNLIDLVDLNVLTNEYYLPEDGHLSVKGNEFAAKQLFKEMQKLSWIDSTGRFIP
jgi:hypothetical protein